MNNSKFKRISALFMAVLFTTLGLFSKPVKANNASAYTYTVSEDGQWVRTQDAYLAGGILFNNLGLSQAEDMMIANGKIYIADAGNSRIVIVDKKTKEVQFVGEEDLSSPTGVFALNNGEILVADYGLSKVALFDKDGKLMRWYDRPNSPVFGKNTAFNPRKVISDNRGNIYVVSEGSYDGIIQISKDGEFLGYFGENNTKITLLEALQDLFYTAAQKKKLFNRIPRTFYNIDMDEKGMIYSVTQGSTEDAVKKHSISGTNMLGLNSDFKMLSESKFVDIVVAKNGQIYAVTSTGLIYEYDNYGNVIFSFGGVALSGEKNGLFSVAAAIEIDDNNYIYVLDKERGIVQVFYPTSFAEITHEALKLYDEGKYKESQNLWGEILKLSGNARMAHNGLGKTYFQEGNFEKAAEHFKDAMNKKEYSESYWEIRNKALQDNGSLIISLVIVLVIAYYLLGFLDKKYKILNPFRNFGSLLLKNKLVSDIALLKKMLKHPIDSMYYLRKDRHGSILGATIIYFIAFVIYVSNILFTSFLFRIVDSRSVSYTFVIVQFFAPITLVVVCNYLVSSITEGIGRLKDVYCLIAYSFAPYVIFMPFLIVATYILTLNEAFIISFGTTFLIAWSAVIFFIGLKEIHDFEISGVIKNILVTVFLMCVVIIVGSIIYMFWDVLIEFIYSVVKELAYNVRK